MKKHATFIYYFLLVLTGSGFISNHAAAQTWQWATGAGGNFFDEGHGIAGDASGNYYVTGGFVSSITFGTTTLTSISDYDVFVVKYDVTGNVIWAKSAGGSGADIGRSIAVDAGGNCYVTGEFRNSSITFGSTTLTNNGDRDIFVVKYDASGNLVWAKSNGGPNYDLALGIAVDAGGNCYVTGQFQDSITFGTTMLTGSWRDMFLAKYDPAGNVAWARGAGGSSSEVGNGIALDINGNCYLTGVFSSTSITFGSITLTNNGAGNSDFFVTKYDPSGNVVWAKSSGGSGDEMGNNIAVDASGNCYVTGIFRSSSLTVGPATLTCNGIFDIFAIKYDSLGNAVWAKSAGGSDADRGLSIAVDAIGNCYVTGHFYSNSITFGTTTLTKNGSPDIFVTKYDSSGNVVWAKGAVGSASGESIEVDASGNCYVTGYFGNSCTFGSITITVSSHSDMFIAKLDGTVTGIETHHLGEIVVFPNPSPGKFTWKDAMFVNGEMDIFNLQGELIYSTTFTNTTSIEIDLSDMAPGIYFAKISTERGVTANKLVLK